MGGVGQGEGQLSSWLSSVVDQQLSMAPKPLQLDPPVRSFWSEEDRKIRRLRMSMQISILQIFKDTHDSRLSHIGVTVQKPIFYYLKSCLNFFFSIIFQ